jgi:chemotaxis protein MotB
MNRADIKSADHYQYGGFNFPELCEFDPAEEKDSSWLISFVDILSLLITLFVLLLSFSHLTQHETTQRLKLANARYAPHTPSVVTAKVSEQTPPPSSPKPPPVLSIPQNIKDMIDVVATAAEVNLVIKDDVLFAEGSAELTPLGRSVLDGIARMLEQNDYPVSVEGHTDNVPIHTAQFPSNWELSSFRATNVARYFIQRGVATERLRAIGYADTRPIADNDSEAGRARNRRVSLVIHVNQSSDKSPSVTPPTSSAPH